MPKEGQPQEYKFKHAKKISMDGYKGIASDLMQLNHPVTDGFMQATDMRSDIVITNMQQDRVADYDQIGSVRVAKLLKLPRLDLWHQNGPISTRRENGAWTIAVNDQKLSQEILQKPDKTNGKRFDEVFTKRFDQEIAKGIESCLKKEKILNNGEYNFAYLLAYGDTVQYDVLYPASLGMAMIFGGGNPPDIAITVKTIAEINMIWNGFYLMASGAQKLLREHAANLQALPNYQGPLIKHHVLEYVAPPIAVDRVARGLVYMKLHGKDLILPQ